jgi:hypothetical protein
MHSFVCSRCHEEKEVQTTLGIRYGFDDSGKKICYACCGEVDKEWMRENGRITLYLTIAEKKRFKTVSNWPGTLLIPVESSSEGNHNIAGRRMDVWFLFEGTVWWGVNIGDSQLLHCKKTNRKSCPDC